MLDEVILEQRLNAVEQAIADLQRRVSANPEVNWLERVTGSISDEAAFLEALQLGKVFRQADRPPDESSEQP